MSGGVERVRTAQIDGVPTAQAGHSQFSESETLNSFHKIFESDKMNRLEHTFEKLTSKRAAEVESAQPKASARTPKIDPRNGLNLIKDIPEEFKKTDLCCTTAVMSKR
eukprot:gene2012-3015_t